MLFPNFKNKHGKDSMFTAKEYLAYSKKIGKYPEFKTPQAVIFCYQRSLMNYILNNHKVTKVKGFYGDTYLLDETKGKIALVCNFGIGAPIVVTLLEELIAFGVKKFISVGTAGTLQKDIKIGSMMLCNRAIRDEGTSHHYLKFSKYAYSSKKMNDKIIKSFKKFNQEYSIGTSWTIDAPYRETIVEARKYQKEGVATVEMEASALFSVAQYRKVEMGAVFTISDSLAELEEWTPQFHSIETQGGLETIYKVAVETLSK